MPDPFETPAAADPADPAAAVGPQPAEVDLRDAEPSALVKISAALHILAGLFVGLTGLQLVGTRWFDGWPDYVPYVLMTLGASHIVVGGVAYRARPWAGYVGAALGPFTALCMLGWLIYAFTSVVSCMLYLSVPLAGLNAIAALAALGGIRRTAEARRRLAEQGMNLGL